MCSKKTKSESKHIPVTTEVRNRLIHYKQDSGLGVYAFWSSLTRQGIQLPPGLSASKINNWLNAKTKTAQMDHLAFVEKHWSEFASRPLKPHRVPVTAEFLKRNENHQKTSGLGAHALFSSLRKQGVYPPDGLTAATVCAWMNRTILTAPLEHLKFVEENWQRVVSELPELMRVPITPDVLKRLEGYQRDSQAGARAFWTSLIRNKVEPPAGLSLAMINSWMNGSNSSARADHLEFVEEHWQHLAVEFTEQNTVLTDRDVAELKNLFGMLGIGPKKLMHGQRLHKPDGLSSAVIGRWMEAEGQTIRKDHFEFVMTRLQTMISKGEGRMPLTPERIAALEHERRRSGVELPTLLRQMTLRGESPPSITVIGNWFRGSVQCANRAHYDAVLKAWKSCPTPSALNPQEFGLEELEIVRGRVVLTDAVRTRLHDLRQRSGQGIAAMLKDAMRNGEDIPKGLNFSVIQQWLNGVTQTAKHEHFGFVMRHWSKTAAQGKSLHWTEMSREIAEQLRPMREAGLIPSRIFVDADDVPDGISPAMISSWVTGNSKRLRSDHLEWVLKRCHDLTEDGQHFIPLTPEIRFELEELRERSGFTQKFMLDGATDKPADVTPAMISGWINGTVAKARADHLAYVRERWKSLVVG